MDQTFQQRTKTADEKFCSECGQIIKLKAEICPSCGVRQLPAPNLTQEKTQFFKGNLIEKFFFPGGITTLVFIVIIFTSYPTYDWLDGMLGSFIIGALCGALAMFFPTDRKMIYIPCSFLITFLIVFVIGMAM